MAQQPVTFTTPQGVAQYPWLSKPDTKFSEEGDYKVNLIIAKEEALPTLKLINQVYAENYEKEVKKAKGAEIKAALKKAEDVKAKFKKMEEEVARAKREKKL